jgi:hypothetical protein
MCMQALVIITWALFRDAIICMQTNKGVRAQALVKVRVCSSCAKKLYWKKERQLKELSKLLTSEKRALKGSESQRTPSSGVHVLR